MTLYMMASRYGCLVCGMAVSSVSVSGRAAVGSRLVGAVGQLAAGRAAGRVEQSDGEPAGAAGQSD